MRSLVFLFAVLVAAHARAEVTAANFWKELEEKRNALSSFHQEFDVSQNAVTAHGATNMNRKVLIDMSGPLWREKYVSGSGTNMRIYDGTDSFYMEEGGDEYVRTKSSSKDNAPLPDPYALQNPDWAKAEKLENQSCSPAKIDHPCVVVKVPLKSSIRPSFPNNSTNMSRTSGGTRLILLDPASGLAIFTRTVQLVESPRGAYKTDVSYTLKRMSFGAPRDVSLFQAPSGDLREVKELSRWDAPRIKKQLAGNPAPDFSFTSLDGKPVNLASLKGKTVLLDFWTTWCPPCRADAPSLDKLYAKYGGKELMIVGISVSEERQTVETFLRDHPHRFPIVLTLENELPRPYQIGVFPTYIVIDGDGAVASAVQGDHGFGDLLKLLKKAGLDTE